MAVREDRVFVIWGTQYDQTFEVRPQHRTIKIDSLQISKAQALDLLNVLATLKQDGDLEEAL